MSTPDQPSHALLLPCLVAVNGVAAGTQGPNGRALGARVTTGAPVAVRGMRLTEPGLHTDSNS